MATRSTIALEYADGTVDQVYCHWDGYLSNNGQLLLKHWQDPFKVQKMMGLGDMSSLGEGTGEQHSFDDAVGCSDCTFYGRDRGETGTEAKRFKDFEDYEKNHQYEEYEYILRRDGEWYVSQYGKPYTLLTEAVAAEIIEAEMAEDE
jgi:hypothetical protein